MPLSAGEPAPRFARHSVRTLWQGSYELRERSGPDGPLQPLGIYLVASFSEGNVLGQRHVGNEDVLRHVGEVVLPLPGVGG